MTFLKWVLPFFSFFSLFSQNDHNSNELYVKAGATLYATQYAVLGNHDDGTHYHYSPSSGYTIRTINNGRLNNYSPCISLGAYHRYKKWLSYYVGFTGTQYKQSFQYTSHNVSDVTIDSSQNFHYNEYDDKGTGTVTNYIFRTEITPVLTFGKTKILLPLPVLDLVFPQFPSTLEVQRQDYQMITPSLYSSPSNNHISATTPLGPPQNVSISLNKNDFNYPDQNNYMSRFAPKTERHSPFIYFPLSLRVEQEIVISKSKWLVGVGVIYSPRAYYYGYNFYLSYCIWRPREKS